MILNVQRYSPGGDVFAEVDRKFGKGAASRLYSLALQEDHRPFLNYLSELYDTNDSGRGVGNVNQLNESTASLLGTQVYNDPLGATFEQAGNVVKNSVKAAAGNWGIWIVALLIGGALFFYFGGAAVVRAAIKRKAKG